MKGFTGPGEPPCAEYETLPLTRLTSPTSACPSASAGMKRLSQKRCRMVPPCSFVDADDFMDAERFALALHRHRFHFTGPHPGTGSLERGFGSGDDAL